MAVLAMDTTTNTPSTRKVRRLASGGKRGSGWEWQRRGRRVRRPDPRSMTVCEGERNLTAVAGLVAFGQFLRSEGIDSELSAAFGHMKHGPMVVYPMGAQLRLMLDLHVAGEGRVFGLEALAHDPLLAKLAGGALPSIDVLYDDLGRFDADQNAVLEQLVARQGLRDLRRRRPKIVHADIDTTVMPMFGSQEGALVGHNPRFHGRPSYHPMLMRIAESDTICGAVLRPGDHGFGGDDVPTVVAWIERLREALGPECVLHVRIDAAGDCAKLLQQLDRLGVFYYVKARITPDLAAAITLQSTWHTIDRDAMDQPTYQGADITFWRAEWRKVEVYPRVVAIRSRERNNGKQLYLWNDLDFTVQCWLTNNWTITIDEIAETYNDRAGIEPLIAELKNGWWVGKAPSAGFEANHAAFLLKLLAHNLLRRFVAARYPALAHWRTPWTRRVLILRPGRLVRSGRSTVLRTTDVAVPMRR
jgi:hypothetical protein